MSQEDIEKLLGRLLTDDLMRQRATTQLAAICEDEGYRLTPDEVKKIKPEDIARLAMVSSWMDTGIKRQITRPVKRTNMKGD
ncbi:MAG: Os1348 family NHLP clan protein [Deltaproteobacteria bacterium]